MSELKVVIVLTTIIGLIICLSNWNNFTEGYRWAVVLFIMFCVALNLMATLKRGE